MNIFFVLMTFILISCGKPKEDGPAPAERIPPRTLVTTVPHDPTPKLESLCYTQEASGNLVQSYMLKGNFYKGSIWVCDGTNSCQGDGIYFHYFDSASSCLTKRGFEDQFTLCMERDRMEERPSTSGALVHLDLIIDSVQTQLWCGKNILKIMFYKSNNGA